MTLTAPAVAAPIVIQGVGCAAGIGLGTLAFLLALAFGAGLAMAAVIGVVALGLVVAAVEWIGFSAEIVLSARSLVRIRNRVRTGGWPSYYMALTDRRFILLGADSWSKKPKPDEVWSCPLSDVRCLSFEDYRWQAFVVLSLRGERRDFVIDWHFRDLALSLSKLR